MAEIEYAVLAQFATVADDGSLTVVGAHQATFEVAGTPAQHVLCVAGRILLGRREPPPMLSLGARTPDGDVPVVARWPLEVRDAPMEDGRRPVAFAATLVAPAPVAGRYALTLLVDDDLVRTLPFTVVDSTAAPAEPAERGTPPWEPAADPTPPAAPGPVAARQPESVPVLSRVLQGPLAAPSSGAAGPAAAAAPKRHGRRAASSEPSRG